MSVEEYSMKFTLLSKYSSYLMSNPKYEMRRFITGVLDLVKEECRTTMLYNDMTLSTFVVYTQSIQEYMLERRGRDTKSGRTDEYDQHRFKKRALNKDIPSAPKANYKRSGGSQLDQNLLKLRE